MSGNRQTIEAEVMDFQHQRAPEAPHVDWDSLRAATPSEILEEIEEGGGAMRQSDIDQVRAETFNKLMDNVLGPFMAGDTRLATIGKQVLKFAKYVDHRAVEHLSLGDIAELSGETKARVSARIKEGCNDLVESAGGKSRAKWQQGKDRIEVQRKALRGNRCQKGGKKLMSRAAKVKSWRKDK